MIEEIRWDIFFLDGAGGNCNSTRAIHGAGEGSSAWDKYWEFEICGCQRPADRTRLHAPYYCCTNSAWTDARWCLPPPQLDAVGSPKNSVIPDCDWKIAKKLEG